MTIHKAKASDYVSVERQYVATYIREYANKINDIVLSSKLLKVNKNYLNSISAELETVYKRLDYILEGRY